MDGALDPWINQLWGRLSIHLEIPLTLGTELCEPSYKIEFLPKDAVIESQRETFPLKIIQNTRITAETHFQDTRHLVLSIENNQIS